MSTLTPAPDLGSSAGFASPLLCSRGHQSITDHRRDCHECAKIAIGFPALEQPPSYVRDIGVQRLPENSTLTTLADESSQDRAKQERREANLARMANAIRCGTRTRNRRHPLS